MEWFDAGIVETRNPEAHPWRADETEAWPGCHKFAFIQFFTKECSFNIWEVSGPRLCLRKPVILNVAWWPSLHDSDSHGQVPVSSTEQGPRVLYAIVHSILTPLSLFFRYKCPVSALTLSKPFIISMATQIQAPPHDKWCAVNNRFPGAPSLRFAAYG